MDLVFIDDYNLGKNVISSDEPYEVIGNSNLIVDILVMVNPVHADIIIEKYCDFKNVNLIFLD